MGLIILKFILMASILGGVIKAYFNYPFIQDNPKIAGGLLILVVLFGLWIIPRSLGFIFKLLIIAACLFGLGYAGYKVFGWGGDWMRSFLSNEDEPMVSQTLEEAVEEQTAAIASYQNHDKVAGQVSEVRSGYFFQMGPSFIKLYGIDAPDPAQNCSDKYGNRYPCGDMSKEALERLILRKIVTCTPVGGDGFGNYIATCAIEGVDVGSAMVSSGWAVADRSQSKVYIPYEKKAHDQKIGLWEGSFTAPWDYRDKVKMQHSQQQNKGKGFFGLFK